MGEDDLECVEGGGNAATGAAGFSAGAGEVEVVAHEEVDAETADLDVDGDLEGGSELEGVLNSAGRTWELC